MQMMTKVHNYRLISEGIRAAIDFGIGLDIFDLDPTLPILGQHFHFLCAPGLRLIE